jgi:hypothetical protein
LAPMKSRAVRLTLLRWHYNWLVKADGISQSLQNKQCSQHSKLSNKSLGELSDSPAYVTHVSTRRAQKHSHIKICGRVISQLL